MLKLKSLLTISFVLFGMISIAQQASNEMPVPKDAHLVNLRDAANANITFDDIIAKYKGKVIYLDFWASWCSPCRREMPHSSTMKKELAGKDVVFVYISSDQSPEKWEGMIKQLQITGDHYLASGSVHQAYNQLLNVKTIPRYVLIDKEGNIVNANAPRPSNAASVTDIKKLL